MAEAKIPERRLYAVSRKEVLAENASRVIRAIDEKVSQFLKFNQALSALPAEEKEAQAVKLINQTALVEFTISGYDDDPRPLWSFDETQRWAWTWLTQQPYCPLFLEDKCLLVVSLLCLGATKRSRFKGFVPDFSSPRATRFQSLLESSVNSLFAKYGNPWLLGTFALARGVRVIGWFKDMRAETTKPPRDSKKKWWQFWKTDLPTESPPTQTSIKPSGPRNFDGKTKKCINCGVKIPDRGLECTACGSKHFIWE